MKMRLLSPWTAPGGLIAAIADGSIWRYSTEFADTRLATLAAKFTVTLFATEGRRTHLPLPAGHCPFEKAHNYVRIPRTGQWTPQAIIGAVGSAPRTNYRTDGLDVCGKAATLLGLLGFMRAVRGQVRRSSVRVLDPDPCSSWFSVRYALSTEPVS
jgi:hypothetical protein